MPSQAFQSPPQYGSPSRPANATDFDIFDWYPLFLSCLKYFIDHAQHSQPVQALAAFMNIQLPYQKHPYPIINSNPSSPRAGSPQQPMATPILSPQAHSVSLIPYIRRMIVTGNDTPRALHGFFGDDWQGGISSLHEIERRNYMFASKSANWLKVKEAYDMGPNETVPFITPLKNASEQEIQMAEIKWSEWLAMQDWMLGPRSLEMRDSPRVKREEH